MVLLQENVIETSKAPTEIKKIIPSKMESIRTGSVVTVDTIDNASPMMADNKSPRLVCFSSKDPSIHFRSISSNDDDVLVDPPIGRKEPDTLSSGSNGSNTSRIQRMNIQRSSIRKEKQHKRFQRLASMPGIHFYTKLIIKNGTLRIANPFLFTLCILF